MADRFAVGIGAGKTWTNADTSLWSATTGGASGASVPGLGDVAIFDANSGGSGAYAVSLNYSPTCDINFAGISAAVPLLIRSSGRGTQRTITSAVVTVGNYVHFQDIVGAGAGSWDISAVQSGDCGGNSGITFSPAQTNYWIGGTGNWSDVAEWANSSGGASSSGRVPLPQDTARFDANSFGAGSLTVTQDMPRIPATDWTGVTNTPTFTTSTAASFFGSLTLVSGLTLTANTQTYTYEGRGASTLTSAGQTWSKALSIHCHSGTLSLGDAFTNAASSSTIILDSGTFNSAGFSVTTFGLAYSTSSNQTLTMGGSLWTLTRGNSDPWGIPAATTVNAGTSTIRLTGTFTAARAFGGAGKTYYNLENATAGAFALQITGSNTFNNIHIDASAAARTVLFTAGTTTTVASMTRDAGTNVITIGSITAASHALAKSGGGTISGLDYLDVSRSDASPASTWYAGANSTDGLNNTGWIFTAAPAGSASNLLLLGVSA